MKEKVERAPPNQRYDFSQFFFLNGLKSATGFQLDHQHDKELRKMAGNAKTIYLAILSNFVKSAIAWLLIHSTT